MNLDNQLSGHSIDVNICDRPNNFLNHNSYYAFFITDIYITI